MPIKPGYPGFFLVWTGCAGKLLNIVVWKHLPIVPWDDRLIHFERSIDMIDELRWVIGLNVVLALWLGMLADSWKGRRVGVWMLIGFLTSVFGLALLIYLPSCRSEEQDKAMRRPFSPKDSYGH
jgi:hypothetical protein